MIRFYTHQKYYNTLKEISKMMYELDFTPPLTKLNGEVTQPETAIGQLLAAQLEMLRDPPLPIRKVFIWATDLYKTNKLNLDKVDMDLLEKWIENNKDFVAFFKSCLLDVFTKAKTQQETA